MTIRQGSSTNGFWQRVCIMVNVDEPPTTRREAPDKEKKNNKNEKGDHL